MNGHLGVVILLNACLITLTMNSKANARMPEQVCLKLRKYEKVRFSS